MYDATYEQIRSLQRLLLQHGITQDDLDLDKFAGLTYSELRSICNATIKRKENATNAD